MKLGVEAQSEVTVSRVLWAIGYHQPPTYYVSQWTLTGAMSGPQTGARFRAELPGEEVTGDWSWYENPFIGTRPFAGLIVANLLLNNWDWKDSNNKLYRSLELSDDAGQRYVVRDVGASLGRTKQFPLLSFFGLPGGQGTKNDLAGFEAQGFVTVQPDDFVETAVKLLCSTDTARCPLWRADTAGRRSLVSSAAGTCSDASC